MSFVLLRHQIRGETGGRLSSPTLKYYYLVLTVTDSRQEVLVHNPELGGFARGVALSEVGRGGTFCTQR